MTLKISKASIFAIVLIASFIAVSILIQIFPNMSENFQSTIGGIVANSNQAGQDALNYLDNQLGIATNGVDTSILQDVQSQANLATNSSQTTSSSTEENTATAATTGSQNPGGTPLQTTSTTFTMTRQTISTGAAVDKNQANTGAALNYNLILIITEVTVGIAAVVIIIMRKH